MNTRIIERPVRAILVLGGVLVLPWITLLVSGCAPSSDNDNSGQGNPDLPPTVSIISPTQDRNIPRGSTITITYTATNSPTDVVAYYDIDGVANSGDEGLIASGLLGGTNQTVDFNTTSVATGTYAVAIRATNAAGTTTQYAGSSGNLATITVNGSPQAAINSPSSDVEVLVNTTSRVDIVFSCNDPENQVSWQTFYDTNRIVDGNEITIAAGAGNADPGSSNTSVGWLTLGIVAGTYEIGLVCTDSAGSSQTLYGNGQVIITSELSLPTITVSTPAEDVVVFDDEEVTINFASSDPSVSDTTITVFLDTNSQLGFDDSEINLAVGLLPSATTITVNSSIIPNDVYFVGAYLERGTQRNVDYAPGKLTVVGVGDLTIAQPIEQVTVKPGTSVTIGWNTNIPTGRGLIDLALFTSDSSGTQGSAVSPDPLAAAKDLPIKPATAMLDTSTLASGFYVVEVSLTPVDENEVPTGEPSRATTAPIRVTTLASIFWVGRIELDEDETSDPPLGHFDGVVFEGVNFEDNAGSSLLGSPLLQDLPLGGAFIIGARYAKPFFANPNGIGAGEAYLIYNQLGVFNRRYSLNAVGSKLSTSDTNPNALAGLRFPGIVFDPTSEDIDGNGQIDNLSEDVDGPDVNGFTLLDRFNEDLDGNGSVGDMAGPTVEDIDLDGFPDLAEDGLIGIDADNDGVIDDPSERFFVSQYINGALDAHFSEDRDGDGKLDTTGDATWGLSCLALLPDVDADGVPEFAFGFQDTDSLPADFRSLFLGITEPSNFGDLTQPNQFERGGLVMVPTSDEQTISSEFRLGRDEDRVVMLDFTGQGFNESPEDAGADDTEQNTTGVEPRDSMIPEGRPLNGQDPFPYVRNVLGSGGNPAACEAGQITLDFVNNTGSYYPASANFIVTRFPAGGGAGADETVTLMASPQSFARLCLDVDDETVRIAPDLFEVALVNPDSGDELPGIFFVDFDERSTFGPATGGSVAYGVTGFAFDGFSFLVAVDVDFTAPTQLFVDGTCEVGGSDQCDETLTGPFYGFHYGDLVLLGDITMESPTHPLAYDRTLANPDQRQNEFGVLGAECAGNCGRVLGNEVSIIEGGAPPFQTISTGFYPGVSTAPVGARILGQRAGDRFGTSISRGRGPDNRVYVGAPRRPGSAGVDAGAVYQFRMFRFWDSANDLAGLNDFDAPKPHQYVIKEVGSSRPDGLLGPLRASMQNAIVYSGADAADRLGEAVLGITDFNRDARADIMMGAPGADGKNDTAENSGAAYIIYRLPPDIEASVSLDTIELDPANVNRLNGLLLNGDAGDQLGSVLAGNCDLNDDDRDDLVIGNPLHGSNDSGEVIVLLGGPNLASPAGGFSIAEIVNQQRAIRIQGISAGDQAGFAVACEGDFDGDGAHDLAVSAPSAAPMFDSDGDDVLDTPGLDLDRDGLDDGLITNPADAGVVYVITNVGALSGTLNLSQMGGALQGFIFVGNRGSDNMGGGVEAKRGTRSQGLAYGGDVNGDGRSDLLVSSILADPLTGSGVPKTNAGEVYLILGFNAEEAEDILNPN